MPEQRFSMGQVLLWLNGLFLAAIGLVMVLIKVVARWRHSAEAMGRELPVAEQLLYSFSTFIQNHTILLFGLMLLVLVPLNAVLILVFTIKNQRTEETRGA